MDFCSNPMITNCVRRGYQGVLTLFVKHDYSGHALPWDVQLISCIFS